MMLEEILIVFGICNMFNGIMSILKDDTSKDVIERFIFVNGFVAFVYGTFHML